MDANPVTTTQYVNTAYLNITIPMKESAYNVTKFSITAKNVLKNRDALNVRVTTNSHKMVVA